MILPVTRIITKSLKGVLRSCDFILQIFTNLWNESILCWVAIVVNSHLLRVVNILFFSPSEFSGNCCQGASVIQTAKLSNLNDTKLRFVLFVQSQVRRGRRENKLTKSYLLGHLHYYRILCWFFFLWSSNLCCAEFARVPRNNFQICIL